ncbi:hypothetical protein [Paenibacillus sp. N3.4]|uniref:hypothetical protein n=1 Tax=Paenibacillus sp. N3.4 TaxID=2603222 RepID=UPI0011CBCD02|nr:hypothetical protein [Paenibacillus sp. N3.4]TXK71677.1 hypothetical protein FU659_32985 [Paenibacillus sp. N3.4]TXK71687.1 hypothetical protein FU659_32870 [Paenibacillus sp. N3.4]
MSDHQAKQQNAETQAHNAVADSLSELNQAQSVSTNRRQAIQLAQEELDQAHAQLAEARTAATESTE